MDCYKPGTSYYHCPTRAADLFKPERTPPPVYYLTDHACVVYNDDDWPTLSEDDEEEAKKDGGETSSNCGSSAGNARMVARGHPPGLLSVRMREHNEKQRFRDGKSDSGYISREGKSASPAGQSTQAAKADTAQAPGFTLKYNKPLTESNVKPPARKPLGAANTATKKLKSISKPTRHRIQVVLTHTKQEKENHPSLSSDSDEIDDPLQATQLAKRSRNLSKGKGQEQVPEHAQSIYNIENLPDPFLLTSEEECDDSFEGDQIQTRETKEEPDSTEGAMSTSFDPSSMTTAGPASASKSCLRASNAPPKGLTVLFKDPLVKYHFYHYPDPNDIWSRCGLPMRLTFYPLE